MARIEQSHAACCFHRRLFTLHPLQGSCSKSVWKPIESQLLALFRSMYIQNISEIACWKSPLEYCDNDWEIRDQNTFFFHFIHCPLAMVAMDSLEKWHELHPEKIEPWLPQILPCFNHYLVNSVKLGSGEVSAVGGPKSDVGAYGSSTGRPSADISASQLARVKEMRAKEVENSVLVFPLDILFLV
eukprot:Gb_14395 [translate_table: standard]